MPNQMIFLFCCIVIFLAKSIKISDDVILQTVYQSAGNMDMTSSEAFHSQLGEN